MRLSGPGLLAAVSCALAVLLALLVALRHVAVAVSGTATRSETTATTTAAATEVDENAPTTVVAAADRTEVDHGMQRCRSFDEDVEHLVALGLATGSHAAAGRREEARALDAESRACFDALVQAHADAGERALQGLLGSTDRLEPADEVRVRVWQLALGAALARRHAVDAASTDALVDSVLTGLRGNAPRAPVLGALIARMPYLRAVHENAVLGLVDDAARGEAPPELAVELLLTLWRNLQGSGVRASQELDSLALLLLEDANVVHRLAACRRLLADPRWRHLALERARKDPALRRETALAAATELAPSEALSALAELHPGSGQELFGAFVTLGSRDVQCLVDAYEHRLATDTEPRLRASLLAGAGSLGHPHGVALAEAAHQHDPDPLVREQARFVLTAHAPADVGERVLQQALDDPLVLADPGRLGAIVLALENLARAGELHALDRVGRRLRATALREADRVRLEELLERHLPRGAAGTNPETHTPR